jgi:hypothetical protein
MNWLSEDRTDRATLPSAVSIAGHSPVLVQNVSIVNTPFWDNSPRDFLIRYFLGLTLEIRRSKNILVKHPCLWAARIGP